MHYTQSCKKIQSKCHSKKKVLQQSHARSDCMVEMTMMNHVDTLTFVEFTAYVEEMFIHGATIT